MTRPTANETAELNRVLFDRLLSSDPERQAAAAVNDFVRTKVREDGFWRRALNPLACARRPRFTCVRRDDTPLPLPAAVTLPFAALPTSHYIRGTSYRVWFSGTVRRPRFTRVFRHEGGAA